MRLAVFLAGVTLVTSVVTSVAALAQMGGGNYLDSGIGSGGGSLGDGVDGNQAFRTWIDKPITFDSTTDGSSRVVNFLSDGTATQVGTTGEVPTDTGKWTHHELGFCATWDKSANGQERCYSVGTGGGQTLVTLQGANGPTWYARP